MPGRACPIVLACVWGLVSAASPAGAAPRVFFADLTSGPNTGGEANAGAFVTLRGHGFGDAQGASRVTIGGGAAGGYRLWSDARVVFQLGPLAQTGSIVVETIAGNSNAVAFTVRAGNLYFVATTGDDAGPGTFALPWRTLVKAKNSLLPGDIAYARDGVSQTAEDNFGASLSIESSGLPGAPKALLAYPGATVTVGSTAPDRIGIRVPNIGIAAMDWVFGGLVVRGEVSAIEIGGTGSARWRVVGNDISCPQGDGQTGCFVASQASQVAFLGNDVHDISTALGPLPSKQYHAVYFTTDTNHVEVAWNHVHDNDTCRAIQFHSSPLCSPACGPADTTGFNQYDLVVHDNLIHGDTCDGINFATVDPSRGPVEAFNNVLYRVGRGPDPPDGSANYAGIHVAGATNTGSAGTGVVRVYNNTFLDCGARGGSDAGAFTRGPGSPGLSLVLNNNVVQTVGGEAYVGSGSSSMLISGTNNLWFGSGVGPPYLGNNVNADPLFVNVAGFDLHVRPGSPALDVAVSPVPATDHDGVIRPQGAAPDLGAYELPAAAAPQVSVSDVSVVEGQAGSATAAFAVTLSAPTTLAVTVGYATTNGTASAGSDYLAVAGTLAFAPGATAATAGVSVLGDLLPEANEDFHLGLHAPVNATLGDGQADGVIRNDDPPAMAAGQELAHGDARTADLAAMPGPFADQDLYRVRQQPHSSYEVVVDAASGDLGDPGQPLVLERLAADVTTVLQSSVPAGLGPARSLRWRNAASVIEEFELVRVRSGSCGTDCDVADSYRVRAYETTGAVARFNNSGTQVSILVLQNIGAQPVAGTAWFWSAAGTLLGSHSFALASRAGLVLNTGTVSGVAGAGGSITVSHDGRFGELAGKAVALEPATGFSFDAPLTARPR